MAPVKPGMELSDWKKIAVWIITISFPLLVTAVGFAHGKLWSHETDIAVIKSVQEKRTIELKEYRDEIRREMTETKAILYKILEELRNK